MTSKFRPEIIQDTVSDRTSVLQNTEKLIAESVSGSEQQAGKYISDTASICYRNPAAEITFYNPDWIISSANLSGTNLFPIIFTERTKQIAHERKASAEKHLKDGETLPHTIFHSDWYLGIILAAIILFSFASTATKSFIPEITRFFLFRGTKEDRSRDVMGIFQWQSTVLNLGSFIVIALFAYFTAAYLNFIPSHISGIAVWLIALSVIIVLVTVRHITCLVTGILSGQEEVFRDYLHTVYQSYRLTALFLFIIVVLMSYTSFLPEINYLIIGGILFSFFYLIRIFRLFILFINRNISIFYLILYLCALEILPVLVSVKYFSGLI